MSRKCLIGLDYGKTNLRCALADSKEPTQLLYYVKDRYQNVNPTTFARQVFFSIEKALAHTGYSVTDIEAIGLGVPAVVKRNSGEIVWGPDWGHMQALQLNQPLFERYGIPIVSDVDTSMATWGELTAGAGQHCSRFAMLTWGTGLGAGLVLNRQVQDYPNNLFPEFGHWQVSDDDWLCSCGARGCLNALVSGGGIAKHARLALESGKRGVLWQLIQGDVQQLTATHVFEAASQGDATACAILKRVAILLARLCINIVYAIQPEKIIIGGGLTEKCHHILEEITHAMQDNCWLLRQGLSQCSVEASTLGDTAGVLGAICKAQTARHAYQETVK